PSACSCCHRWKPRSQRSFFAIARSSLRLIRSPRFVCLPALMEAVKRLAIPALAAFLFAGCGSNQAVNVSAKLRCPAKAAAGWQRLADRIHAPVFCPSWMPSPLDARIGGPWTDVNSVSRDRSYLVSFLWHEKDSGDVHVNFRGYPGRRGMPTCRDL